MEIKWNFVAKHMGHLAPFHNVTLRLRLSDETQIAMPLKDIAAEMGSNVAVGSYPVRLYLRCCASLAPSLQCQGFLSQSTHDWASAVALRLHGVVS